MDTNFVTTPFGRRAMTRAMLTGQSKARDVNPAHSVDKWKLYRALCEARGRLGISDRTLALLNALLSFYPKTEISSETGLVVFPSNQQLSLRANGMAEQTIRRHLALLVNAGLIARKDSANGKRYSRRHRDGEIREAFGFSLAPLLARSSEIEAMAQDVIADRLRLQNVRESITICRRDIAKLIAMAEIENAPGEWPAHYQTFRDIIDSIPRNADIDLITTALQKLRALRVLIINTLDTWKDSRILGGNPSQNERHIQISESESSLDSEPETVTEIAENVRSDSSSSRTPNGTIPLSLVLSACPAIADYAPCGDIRDWRDLSAAANVVGRMFGISPSAYQAACSTMGAISTAVAVSCILERSEHIQSPGGYLRHLTRQSEAGSFSAAQMLMGLMKTREQAIAELIRN
ncbi:replication initiation protein RepC [Rhizobium sp. PP-F2F-G38]|uniref:Replication initiation protein RepC n=1 Tax=Ferranicluibacter rubi TaxID=2715133 RepID=A0AA43ZJ65_9HYPH|nr:plasmid replication protein RepC [Ferranicluibacter rubi]PYE32433.1 replication initiation protein RepC [Rhizobium sp. PP-WC-1G-195]PYE95861.1 replication initiation protein RepC [Rhizobium sp. PP-F2F-G38]TCP77965.1 replication initiation protein RepC [Rhizobium sp. PP-CC-2G-626]TCQ22801.1 replication initiation protein RepC [Rhizobium sp. PP-CC-3G-465]NHT78895.1 replication initiation protein RepC [Ferranicluibacter rubi]